MLAGTTACTPKSASLVVNPTDRLAGLNCSLESSVSPESCSASLQVVDATLSFLETPNFRLVSEYQACYQRESITVNGSYRPIANGENSQQLELQASSIKGSNIIAPELLQTVATVHLDAKGSRGRYIDIWATKYRLSDSEEPPPEVPLSCERRP